MGWGRRGGEGRGWAGEGGRTTGSKRPHQPCLIKSAGSTPALKDVGFLSTCPSYHCVTHSHWRLPFIIWSCMRREKGSLAQSFKARPGFIFSPQIALPLSPLSPFLSPFISSSLFIPPLPPVLLSASFPSSFLLSRWRADGSNLTPPAMTNGHLKRPTCQANSASAKGAAETDEEKIYSR